jgi:glycosyltransferase involved in cell wall biosynthesis
VVVAPLPPPAGGIASWTEALLAYSAADDGVEIVHVNSALRSWGISQRSKLWRIVAGAWYSVPILWNFLCAVRREKAEVVHLCTSGSFGFVRDLLILSLSRMLGVPVVVHLRFGRIPKLVSAGRGWEARLLRLVVRRATRLMVLDMQSQRALEELVPASAVLKIPNPAWRIISRVNEAHAESHTRVLLFAGHITPVKGLRELVRACRDIGNHAFRLELLGPVEPRFQAELERIARDRDEGCWLKFAGPVSQDEVIERMIHAWACVLPSYTEGFPNTVLEAMTAGMPVIATAVGAVPEMLQADAAAPCGVCVPPGDAMALRDAISFLLDHPEQAAELGRRAQERAFIEYTAAAIYPRYCQVWRECAHIGARVQRRPKPTRVLLVAPIPPPPGGIATWAQGLLRYAGRDEGVRIWHVNSAPYFRAVTDNSVVWRIVSGLVYSTVVAGKSVAALVGGRIDTVHICTGGSIGLARDLAIAICGRLRGARVILHLHFGQIPAVVAARNWEALLMRMACRIASCLIVLDAAAAAALRALAPRSSVAVIPNPAWNLEKRLNLESQPSGDRQIVFVGYITHFKGVYELVTACAGIQHPGLRLVMVGPVRERVRADLTAIAGVRDEGRWLTFTGQLDGPAALGHIARAYAVALPSHSEGFPVTVLDAMALGKPVVATPVGALPDMLQSEPEERCGVLVPVGDARALREAIETLLERPELAHELGQRGKRRVEREYSPEVLYPKYRAAWSASGFDHVEEGASHSALTLDPEKEELNQ